MQEERKESFSEQVKKILFFRITKNNIIQLMFAFLVNIIGGYIANSLQPPFWLDTIGTMFAAVQLGPLAALIVGGLSSLCINLHLRLPLIYVLIHVVIALLVGFLFPHKDRKNRFVIVSLCYLVGISVALVSLPFNLYYYNGFTGNKWGDALYEYLRDSGSNAYVRALAACAFVTIPDALISMLGAILLSDRV